MISLVLFLGNVFSNFPIPKLYKGKYGHHIRLTLSGVVWRPLASSGIVWRPLALSGIKNFHKILF
jgi:hypothetical protein